MGRLKFRLKIIERYKMKKESIMVYELSVSVLYWQKQRTVSSMISPAGSISVINGLLSFRIVSILKASQLTAFLLFHFLMIFKSLRVRVPSLSYLPRLRGWPCISPVSYFPRKISQCTSRAVVDIFSEVGNFQRRRPRGYIIEIGDILLWQDGIIQRVSIVKFIDGENMEIGVRRCVVVERRRGYAHARTRRGPPDFSPGSLLPLSFSPLLLSSPSPIPAFSGYRSTNSPGRNRYFSRDGRPFSRRPLSRCFHAIKRARYADPL